MQNIQGDKMTEEEIIKYVDDLIKANKRGYDKRLSPLLYDFFLRANEKFEWSREKFLERYQNFRNNVRKIKFKKLKDDNRKCVAGFTDTFVYGEKTKVILEIEEIC